MHMYGGSGWLPLCRPESWFDSILKWEGDWAKGLEEEDNKSPALFLPLFSLFSVKQRLTRLDWARTVLYTGAYPKLPSMQREEDSVKQLRTGTKWRIRGGPFPRATEVSSPAECPPFPHIAGMTAGRTITQQQDKAEQGKAERSCIARSIQMGHEIDSLQGGPGGGYAVAVACPTRYGHVTGISIRNRNDNPETAACALMSMGLPKAATVSKEHACVMSPIRLAGQQLVLPPSSPQSPPRGRPALPSFPPMA
ncbi:hypothetical protein M419DRAFT_38736 [Trichoderma reesei RUT C-30]|uniref:Uncharacterized protein n=1 Tax=Hypocrea jecorina (strain ATCC 56765 / BCRC 32924 / NRRL 11460 / Rut C-30) TaxID=1344414 RepID=A0A024S1A7_HYPJR|nr:hypothetical protein M419DRAFT_38736 [Trichoderma reesei RUT C-30]